MAVVNEGEELVCLEKVRDFNRQNLVVQFDNLNGFNNCFCHVEILV